MIEATLGRGNEAADRHAERLSAPLPQADVLALWRDVFASAHATGKSSDLRGAELPPQRIPAAGTRGDAASPSLPLAARPGDGNGEAVTEQRGTDSDGRHPVTGKASGGPSARPTPAAWEGASLAPAAALPLAVTAPRYAGASNAEPSPASAIGRSAPAASLAWPQDLVHAGGPAGAGPASQPVAASAFATTRRAPLAGPGAAASPPKLVRSVPDELPAAESVRVFQDAAGLQVVVRHIGISAESAVWCAMETARQLTGDRRALQLVTLNGRSIYASADGVSARSGRPTSIVFSC